VLVIMTVVVAVAVVEVPEGGAVDD
jgi:hypothetical protein